MWTKVLWSEARKRGLHVFDCCDENTLNEAKGKDKTVSRCSQSGCEIGIHLYCIAWVEENTVKLPRVVVEWEQDGLKYRLIETPNGIYQERLRTDVDNMGVQVQWWVLVFEISQPMVKALVSLVGQK